MIGTSELIIIAIVIFVLFGASAIPKFAKSIGQAKAAFKEGTSEGQKKEKTSRATRKPKAIRKTTSKKPKSNTAS